MARYAIYYAPSVEDPLWAFGSEVIGYDAARGLDIPSPPPAGLSIEAWRSATEEPRRYGFHGTIKAPFELADGRTSAGLIKAVREFAAEQTTVVLDNIVVAALGSFIALMPEGDSGALQRLAFAAVEVFEEFRGPLGDADRARRMAGGKLSPRQVELLDRYDYPYVAEQFRFHMTLTGPLSDDLREPVQLALAERYAAIATAPVHIDRLAIFEQPSRDARFRIIEAVPLG
jgi:putative phosphonate metabolism protein